MGKMTCKVCGRTADLEEEEYWLLEDFRPSIGITGTCPKCLDEDGKTQKDGIPCNLKLSVRRDPDGIY